MKYLSNDAELMRMQMQTSKMDITDPGSLFRIHNQLSRDQLYYRARIVKIIYLASLVKLFAPNFTPDILISCLNITGIVN